MSARSTFEAVVAPSAVPGSAANVRVATNQTNALTAQESINAVGVNIGANPAFGVTAAHDATIRAANATYQVARATACATEQSTIQVAKDVLRNSGDVGPT